MVLRPASGQFGAGIVSAAGVGAVGVDTGLVVQALRVAAASHSHLRGCDEKIISHIVIYTHKKLQQS